MFDLFKSELIRFRSWALIAAAVNLAILGFLSRLVDLAQQPLQVYQVFGIGYAVAGALLGLYQMGSYRRPNRWLGLLHRPLHRLRIAAALTAAGALLLLATVALPILLVALGQALFTARVVDLRHELMPLAACLIAVGAYLAGAYAMVAPRRYAFAVVVLPVWLMFAQAGGLAMLAVQTTVVLLLAGLLAIAFRPDPERLVRQPLAALATALPVQLAAYFLLWILGFGVELGWTLSGTHPLSTPTPPAGGTIEADQADGKRALRLGLADSRDPEAALWREQAALSDVVTLYPMRGLPRRGELSNPGAMEFDDAEHGIRWVFSHDRMRYVGRGQRDGRARGELGVGAGNAAFPAPAMAYADGYLFDARAAYQYDASQQRLFERVRLPAGEVMAGPPEPAGDNVIAFSDRAVYVYPGREAANGLARLAPLLRAPMPGPVGRLSRIDVMELLDGYLLSFTYSWGVWAGELQQPFQEVLRVDNAGQVRVVARRTLRLDLPAAYSTRVWWLSPALRALCLGAQDLFAAPDPLRAVPEPVPASVRALAVAGSVLAVLAALWLMRRQTHPPYSRALWLLLCAVVGLPALASLWLLMPRREAALSVARPVAPALA